MTLLWGTVAETFSGPGVELLSNVVTVALGDVGPLAYARSTPWTGVARTRFQARLLVHGMISR